MTDDWAETRASWKRLKTSWRNLWLQVKLARADRHLVKAAKIYLECNRVDSAAHVIAAMNASLKEQ